MKMNAIVIAQITHTMMMQTKMRAAKPPLQNLFSVVQNQVRWSDLYKWGCNIWTILLHASFIIRAPHWSAAYATENPKAATNGVFSYQMFSEGDRKLAFRAPPDRF